jgi:type II secretory pathway component PulK
MMVMRKQQGGIALIQVIITTTIILLLSIFYLTVAKSQVGRAKALQDKTEAYLTSYSGKNQVLFALLTDDFEDLRRQGWNFHGKPFLINGGTRVQLQDLNGLLSLTSMTQGDFLEKLLVMTINKAEARTITASLMDWIDTDSRPRGGGAEQNHYPAGLVVRNGPVQSFTELAYVNGMTLEAEQVLMENTTFQPTPFFNPMTAPEVLLAAFTGDRAKAAAVSALKLRTGFSQSAVIEASGMDQDEAIAYIIGPDFRMTLDTHVGDAYYGKIEEYRITPYRQYPVTSLSNVPRQQISMSGSGQ